MSSAVAKPVHDYSGVTAMPAPAPFAHCLDNPAPNHAAAPRPSAHPPTTAISTSRPSTTAMLKVLVPPGAAPGSTIHVQVPGEPNRILAARVPPHCSEFHVSYEPRQTTSRLAPPKDMVHAVGGLHAHAHAVPTTHHPPSSAGPPTTKLVLVRVPPGTASGTTLHVQVPGEPGRLLSAQVPSGNNVREFHVSYQPRPTASPYGSGGIQQQQQQQQYSASSTYQSHQNRPQQYQNNGYQQQQQQSNNNGGWGSAVMPIAGGVATGVAAAMVYDHFAHHNNNNNNSTQQQAYDNRDGDYGGDYGGGDDDYGGGGGDDYGGGDFGGGDY
jgi:hypothetical protein